MTMDAHVLSSALHRVRQRWFYFEWSRVAAWSATVGAACVLAVAGVGALANPGNVQVVALAAAAAAITLAATLRIAWPLRRRPVNAQVARFIEERCPELEDRLASAAGLMHSTAPSPFESRVVAEAARLARDLDLGRVIATRDLRRRTFTAVGAVAMLGCAMFVAREPMARAWWTVRQSLFPIALSVAVEPGDVTVVEGQGLRVRARVLGLPSAAWTTPLQLRTSDGKAVRVATMTLRDERFESDLGAVKRSFTYRVEGRGVASREFRVDVRRPPRVARIDLEYEYPAFTGLARRVEENGGDVFAPRGTRVRVGVHTDEPVRSGRLAIAGATPVELSLASPTRLDASLVVSDDAAYRVALTAENGLTSDGDTEYFIRVMDDRPPEVRIARPAGDQRVTPLEEVVFEVRADDDYGVDRLELVVLPRGERELVVPLGPRESSTSKSGRYTLLVEDLHVAPGDFVSFYARARDVGRGKRPTTSQTDLYFLEVGPFSAEFEAAQSQAFARGAETFDDLAAQQKEVVIATWKLERRANAGRSRDDVSTVARAQADVKSRAQQLAARSLAPPRAPRRGAPSEPPPEPASAQGPMQLAVAAMDQAQRLLEAVDTTRALPHEMEALNQLLRAQADVRRRQVARQQAGAGGGRTGTQDVSALFDRELQRQQQTNYENRASATTQETPPRDDTLDKLRELARRQDDLAQRARDLARSDASLSREEARRRLERLARDQQELERRAAQLGQQMRSAAQAGGQGAETEQAMRDAVDEIRRATQELQQGNAGGAGARGAQGSERLREAERRAAGAGRDTSAPSVADLQLELQQIAEAQRRLAHMAAAQGASAGSLASQQHEVAERAGRAEQAAKQLAASRGVEESTKRAARGVSRQGLAERMRQAAREAKAGADQQAGGGAWARQAQALADAADRAARTLSSANGDDEEGTRVASQLARVREAKEALTRAEERLRRELDSARGASNANASKRAPASRGENTPGDDRGRRGESPGTGSESARVAAAQQEYARSLAEARQALQETGQGLPGAEGATPESRAPTTAAPGTEAFKQDFARWDQLRRNVIGALERAEAALNGRLAARLSRDRLAADLDDRVPDAYRRQISRYYESISGKDRP